MTGFSQAHEPLLQVSTSDARADRGRRDISVSQERVTIRRRLQGIDMRLTLAISAYAGVALCLREAGGDRLVYQVRLVHRDQDLSVVLHEAPDDRDIVADWRLWARVLNLPALVERELGRFEPFASATQPDEAGAVCVRRKRPLKRRPRFLARRRIGEAEAAPVWHAGEREIIARS